MIGRRLVSAVAPHLYILDRFEDIDNTLLPNHTPDKTSGSSWYTITGSLNNLRISSNQLICTSATGNYALIDATTADCHISTSLTFHPSTTTWFTYVLFRSTNSANYWGASLRKDTGLLRFIKIEAGSGSLVASTPAPVVGNTYKMDLYLKGSLLRVRVNDTELSTVSTFNQSITTHGIGFIAADATLCQVDYYRVEALP